MTSPAPAYLSAVARALEILRLSCRTDRTWGTYDQSIRIWLAHCGDVGLDPLAATREDALRWHLGLQEAGKRPATVNLRAAACRALYRELADLGAVETNPFARVPTLELAEFSRTPYLTDPEVRRLLGVLDAAAATGDLRALRDRAWIGLALHTGLRRSEVFGADCEDIAVEGEHDVLRFVTKGGRERRIPLRPRVLEKIRAWQAAYKVEAGPLWRPIGLGTPSEERRARLVRRLSIRAGEWGLRAWCRRADVTHHVTLHSLRATFVTLALGSGSPLHLVQYAVGHSDPRTTIRYDKARQSLDHHPGDVFEW